MTTSSKKIFVSYKYQDPGVLELPEYDPDEDTGYQYTPRHYVDKIIDTIGSEHIYKGEKSDDDASHLAHDTIDSKLKEKIFDSSITIVLISPNMYDRNKPEKDQWIPNEISYSLRVQKRGDRTSGTNGVLAIALPDCNGNYDYVVTNESCGVRSWRTPALFSIVRNNMFNRKEKNHDWCNECQGHHHYGWDHSYVHPIKWDEFIADHNKYINRVADLKEVLDEFELSKTHD